MIISYKTNVIHMVEDLWIICSLMSYTYVARRLSFTTIERRLSRANVELDLFSPSGYTTLFILDSKACLIVFGVKLKIAIQAYFDVYVCLHNFSAYFISQRHPCFVDH